jgi:hypothetical protein
MPDNPRPPSPLYGFAVALLHLADAERAKREGREAAVAEPESPDELPMAGPAAKRPRSPGRSGRRPSP